MDTTTRCSSPVSSSLVRRLRLAVVAASFAVLASMPAGATLHQYRVEFEPSPSPDAAGYTLHVGLGAGDYSAAFDLGSPPAQGGTILYAVDLEDSSDLYVAVSAYDAGGEASVPSNEIRVAAVVPPPPAPDPGTTDPGTTDPGTTDPGTTDPGPTDPGTTDPGPTGPGSGGGAAIEPIASDVELGIASGADGMIRSMMAGGDFNFVTMDSLAADGNLRPVSCDLDGDGELDLVVGFGPKSGGQVAIILMKNGVANSLFSLEAGPDTYRRVSGRTNPSCGDLDGDGRAEIVVGFGRRMRGVVQVFDDIRTGFRPIESARSNAEGYMQIPVLNGFWGPIYPAIGDIDGDGRGELVAGMGRTRGGHLTILDDLTTGFAIHPANQTGQPWIDVDPFPAASDMKSRTFPTLGDIDGDGRDEIAVSFGPGSEGRVALLNDAVDGFFSAGPQPLVVAAGRVDYQTKDGLTRSVLSDIDGDGRAELIVGFRGDAANEVQVFNDLMSMMTPMETANGFVTSTDAASEIRPVNLP